MRITLQLQLQVLFTRHENCSSFRAHGSTLVVDLEENFEKVQLNVV